MTNQTIARETAEKCARETLPMISTPEYDEKYMASLTPVLTALILTALTRVEDRNRAQLEAAEEVVGALEHTLRAFNSMADRGRYPLELLAGEKYFLGKQGWKYLTDALARWTAAQGRL